MTSRQPRGFRQLEPVGSTAPAYEPDVGVGSAPLSLSAPLRVRWFRPCELSEEGLLPPDGWRFRAWDALWRSLSWTERDPYTLPALLASWLDEVATASPELHRLAWIEGDDDRPLAVVPLQLEQMRCGCRARHDLGLAAGSIAVRRLNLDRVLGALFQCRPEGFGRLRSLELVRVDGTHHVATRARGRLVSPLDPRSVVQLGADADETFARYSSNLRHALRRARKRLAEHGPIRVHDLRSPAEVERGLRRFVRVDANSWKAERGETLMLNLRLLAMFRRCLPAMARRGEASAQLLSVGGHDVAAQLSFRTGDVFHVVKTSFDSAYADGAPGRVLLDETLRYIAPRAGARRVSLVVRLGWHARWHPVDLPTHRVWLFAPGPRGWLARLRDVPPKHLLKELLRAVGIDASALKQHALGLADRIRGPHAGPYRPGRRRA